LTKYGQADLFSKWLPEVAILGSPDLKHHSAASVTLPTFSSSREESFMLTGRRFKLKERTLAVEALNGERKAVSIPIGTILKVIPGASVAGQTVDVLWGNRTLEMFACDVEMRGTEIIDPQSEGLNERAAWNRGSV